MTKFARPVLFACLLAAASPSAGFGASPAMTVREALSLAVALRNLDGHMVIVKDGTVMVPWEFGNAGLRMKIADDLEILARVERSADAARVGMVREFLQKLPAGSKDLNGTPLYDEFQKQYAAQVLDAPAAGVEALERIKASDLRLDRNEIAGTVINALKPILDVDVH